MNNRISQQFQGFINSYPLWENLGPFDIEQFKLPELTNNFPQENEILKEVPSLTNKFVLGKRMEGFFSFLIQITSEYRLIAQNLQIVQDKITIGEIDFLLEDIKTQEKLHIELVYKFYLYDPAIEREMEKWIGPNRKDSLPQKIRKLQEKQLPLLYHEATSRVLSDLNINNNVVKQLVCFKANLFVPLNMNGKLFPIINNSCISGYWIKCTEFNEKIFSRNEFFAPKKPTGQLILP